MRVPCITRVSQGRPQILLAHFVRLFLLEHCPTLLLELLLFLPQALLLLEQLFLT
tara:strand:- start:237 stop:401 length:165 start_codon:yes stop_codon:yes gene_type:complete